MHLGCISAVSRPTDGSLSCLEVGDRKLDVLQVRHRERECIRGVDRGYAGQAKDDANHLGHLRLFRAPVPCNHSLDQSRCILDHYEPGASAYEQCDSARMS
jgi:hypothetical protein